jgi:hypothetical protein
MYSIGGDMDFAVNIDFYVSADTQKDAYFAAEKIAKASKLEYNILDVETL